MTIETSQDEKTLAIGVSPQTYERLRQRAVMVETTVDDYVRGLVVLDAYAPSRIQRWADTAPSVCLTLAAVLLAVAYFTWSGALLLVALLVADVPCGFFLAERIVHGPRSNASTANGTNTAGGPTQG